MTQDQDTYRVRLESFEGPLDLLLYLIRKNEVDVYDIPIALIVEQYMAYLELMRSLNLDVAGDFLVMAATLTHIKSRLLLPRDERAEAVEDEAEEGLDPRAELVRKLVEYQRYKEAAAELIARPALGRDVFVRPLATGAIEEAAEAAGIQRFSFEEVGVFELLSAFQEVVERGRIAGFHEVAMERMSIVDRINQLLTLFRDVDTIGFDQIFTDLADKALIVATFLAILELVRLKVIRAFQERPFGPISLARAVAVDDQWLNENLPRGERRK